MAERPGDRTLQGADGLRTLACLMVVFHHLSQQLTFNPGIAAPPAIRAIAEFFASSGSAGVSVFFVLSGFLLAAPFWRAWLSGGAMPSLAVYAGRRAGRIVPGFAVNLLLFFVLAILFEPQAPALVWRYFAGLTFTSGFHWMTFFPAEGNGPLWSIGFEVFSYLMLPLAMALLFVIPAGRRSAARGLALWLVVWLAVVAVNGAVQVVFAQDDVGRGWQYGLTGGAKEWMPRYSPWGLFAHFALGSGAAGFAVAWATSRTHGTRQGLFNASSLLLFVLWCALLVSRTNQDQFSWTFQGQPYYFPAFPLLTAALLACLTQSGLVGRVFDNPFSRLTARLSFGLYLWHTLVISRFNGGISDTVDWLLLVAVTLVLSYVVASLSWKYVEQPFLLRPRRSARFYAGAALVFLVFPLALAAVVRPAAFSVPAEADTAYSFAQGGAVTGLAFDGQGQLYATKNGSEVYRIGPDRRAELIYTLPQAPAEARLTFERPRNEPLATPKPGFSILNPENPWFWNLHRGPSGQLFVAAGTRVVILTPQGEELNTLLYPFDGTFGVMDVALGPDGALYVGDGRTVYREDLTTGERAVFIDSQQGIDHQVSRLFFDPSGTTLYVCDFDHRNRSQSQILAYSVQDGRVAGRPRTVKAEGVVSGTWTAQGPVFVAAFTGTVFRWTAQGLQTSPTFHLGPTFAITSAGAGWDPTFLYTANWDGTVGRLPLPTGGRP